jgi:hypothetical protein
MKYTIGILQDGTSILCDGKRMAPDEIVDALNKRESRFHADPTWRDLEAACREYHDNLESLSSEERRSMVALMAGYWNAIWESLYEPQTQETKDG